MTHQVVEDIITIAREFPAVPSGKLALGLQEISKHTAALQRLNEAQTARELSAAELKRRVNVRSKVANVIKELFGVEEVIFHTDPRSIAVRFPLPSGNSNLWDKENFGVRF